jgi:hypothetical protein
VLLKLANNHSHNLAVLDRYVRVLRPVVNEVAVREDRIRFREVPAVSAFSDE